MPHLTVTASGHELPIRLANKFVRIGGKTGRKFLEIWLLHNKVRYAFQSGWQPM